MTLGGVFGRQGETCCYAQSFAYTAFRRIAMVNCVTSLYIYVYGWSFVHMGEAFVMWNALVVQAPRSQLPQSPTPR
jgi:hypothetical protein